jgi:hypothetical protein
MKIQHFELESPALNPYTSALPVPHLDDVWYLALIA